jgi:hypothetical protein
MARKKGEAPATAIAGASDVTPVYHDKASNIMESTTTPVRSATAPASPNFTADRIAADIAERERVLATSLRFANTHSQRNFGAIESLARITLLSMETPEGHCNPEDIAMVLRSILHLASDAAEEINNQAANAGMGYVDHEAERRLDALRKLEQQIAG